MVTPHIPKELLDYLLKVYPDCSPNPDTPDRMIWVKHGEIKVVRHLQSLFTEQQKNVLTKD